MKRYGFAETRGNTIAITDEIICISKQYNGDFTYGLVIHYPMKHITLGPYEGNSKGENEMHADYDLLVGLWKNL